MPPANSLESDAASTPDMPHLADLPDMANMSVDDLNYFTRAIVAEDRANRLEQRLDDARTAQIKLDEALGMHDPGILPFVDREMKKLSEAIGPGPYITTITGQFVVAEKRDTVDGVTVVFRLCAFDDNDFFRITPTEGDFEFPNVGQSAAEKINIGDRFRFEVTNR